MINFKDLKSKRIETIVFLLILVFYTIFITHKIELPNADDMARHVINGREILHGHFEVLFKNVFSYTLPDATFINHHWLSGVLFYILLNVIGWSGLIIFKDLILLATFIILFALAKRKSNFWLPVIFSIPTIIIIADRGNLRPEMFSYLFIALFLYILDIADEKPNTKKIYWLIPLQILWVNLHLFFIIGPALVGGFLIGKLFSSETTKSIKKKISIVFVTVSFACLVNPNILAGALYPLRILHGYGMEVTENHSPFYFFRIYPFWEELALIILFASIFILMISFVFSFRKKSGQTQSMLLFYFLAASGSAVVSLFVVRFSAAFAMIFLPAICMNLYPYVRRWGLAAGDLPEYLKRILPAAGAFIIIASLAGLSFWAFRQNDYPGIGLTKHSSEAGNFYIENGLKGPIFNDFNVGSYLVYYLYPKEREFVDNRPEAFSEDFFKNTYLPITTGEEKWQKALEKFNFNTIFFYRYDSGFGINQFFYDRMTDPEWALVYADGEAVIFVRNNPSNQDIINKFKITPDNVEDRMGYLLNSNDYNDMVAAADNFNLVGRTDLGMETFFHIVEKWPKSGKIWMVMGEWELGNKENGKSPLLAIQYFNNAINVGWNTAEVYSHLGEAYARIEEYGPAKEALKKALKINPERDDAQSLLDDIESKE